MDYFDEVLISEAFEDERFAGRRGTVLGKSLGEVCDYFVVIVEGLEPALVPVHQLSATGRRGPRRAAGLTG
ncbi:hypothetical protein [Salininema proteolyticum]|uniref:Uncharacterized protein n=1 Tax=Salininema proteolyticum TaxID=1607685 RepID=A0ABV8TS79_9ACTN